jgi:hypothetical protein
MCFSAVLIWNAACRPPDIVHAAVITCEFCRTIKPLAPPRTLPAQDRPAGTGVGAGRALRGPLVLSRSLTCRVTIR